MFSHTLDDVCAYLLSRLLSVRLTLPLSSSLPASLSDESVMTPDAENAVVSPILPFLYLGNERDAQDLDLLQRLNIGYVVNVTTHLPLYHVNSGLRYKRLPATDNSKQNLRQYFEEVFEFIGESPISLLMADYLSCCVMLHYISSWRQARRWRETSHSMEQTCTRST